MDTRDPGAPLVLPRRECGTCGAHGPWRPHGHADWCADIHRANNTPRPLQPILEHNTWIDYQPEREEQAG